MLLAPEYNFRNEFFDLHSAVTFISDLGKTEGILAPNEFWYFWRRFFRYQDIQYLDKQELAKIDTKTFLTELAALQSVFDIPFAMKGHIINWNIPYVSSLFDKVLFLYIRREPLYNAQSLVKSREDFFGCRDNWYSFKPKEYDMLKELNPLEQVAGQVHFTNLAIEAGLRQLDDQRQLTIKYEDFCVSPRKIFEQIRTKLAYQGYEMNASYLGHSKFIVSNKIQLPIADIEEIRRAYQRFSGIELTL